MPLVYLTRRETFNAAHKLWVPDWSEEQNLSVFGKCAHPNYHGHNYTLFVTLKGEPDPVTGIVYDAKALKDIIRQYVTDTADHRNFNVDPTFLPKGVQPTAENIVIYAWKAIQPHLPIHVSLHSVKLMETENIFAEYLGE